MRTFEKVELSTGETIWVAATVAPADREHDGPRDVAGGGRAIKTLQGFGETLGGIVSSVHKSLAGIRPDEVSLEFGLEVGCQAGEWLAGLADVSTNASVTVTLTWNRAEPGELPQ
ncbi:CU044_2847 family protein [Nonomuraea sp. NPDC050153]|uniref:CU044_2847 family protein n=1 Tax=Nonomuraea sp. NPDC050153 TaxID=3364359 RepID=UPI0037A77883